ncbi:response regulator transcription factor [Rhodosalinus sediminis]|uniref:response regulator transcription factor n=1 Tax=Rhodosalinus sediminis TaxID=1940533 RepID=UPI0023564F75|nr:response regulator transcription factor [Rhodosalinus sediminis]
MSTALAAAPTETSFEAKRVLVADDHQLMCEVIAYDLERTGDFDVDLCTSADELQKKLGVAAYDLVLLDTRFPDPISVGFVKQVVAKVGNASVLLLAEHAYKEFATACLSEGAAGIVEKNVSQEVLMKVIGIVSAGGRYVPAHTFSHKNECVNAETGLTSEEQFILARVAEGYSDKALSLEMHVKISHVKNAVLKARSKLNARNRCHAVMIARELEII